MSLGLKQVTTEQAARLTISGNAHRNKDTRRRINILILRLFICNF
jgi:hypothetical protein